MVVFYEYCVNKIVDPKCCSWKKRFWLGIALLIYTFNVDFVGSISEYEELENYQFSGSDDEDEQLLAGMIAEEMG